MPTGTHHVLKKMANPPATWSHASNPPSGISSVTSSRTGERENGATEISSAGGRSSSGGLSLLFSMVTVKCVRCSLADAVFTRQRTTPLWIPSFLATTPEAVLGFCRRRLVKRE